MQKNNDIENLQQNLVRDRTFADVEDIKLGLDNPKGAYNIQDLNRVELTVEKIKQLIYSLGDNTVSLNTKTDWSYEYPFTTSNTEHNFNVLLNELNRYDNNLKTIFFTAYSGLSNKNIVDFIENLNILQIDVNTANMREQMLYYTLSCIKSTLENQVYCGEVYCGE